MKTCMFKNKINLAVLYLAFGQTQLYIARVESGFRFDKKDPDPQTLLESFNDNLISFRP